MWSDSPARFFSIEQANALLPDLASMVGAQLALADRIKGVVRTLVVELAVSDAAPDSEPNLIHDDAPDRGDTPDEATAEQAMAEQAMTEASCLVEHDVPGDVIDITTYDSDDKGVRVIKQKIAKMISLYRDGWERVEKLGVVVKDANRGLLDFYGRVDERVVWLCWEFGEPGLNYYHELGAGFSQRKPLAQVRDRMLN